MGVIGIGDLGAGWPRVDRWALVAVQTTHPVGDRLQRTTASHPPMHRTTVTRAMSRMRVPRGATLGAQVTAVVQPTLLPSDRSWDTTCPTAVATELAAKQSAPIALACATRGALLTVVTIGEMGPRLVTQTSGRAGHHYRNGCHPKPTVHRRFLPNESDHEAAARARPCL